MNRLDQEGDEEAIIGCCYECRDNNHEQCIGIPCLCPCPGPSIAETDAEVEAALAKLTPHERKLLGFA
jgi:hypothetical protein